MLEVNGIEAGEYLQYKGRPLVRKDDEIFYGDISKKYVKMLIMTDKKAEKLDETIPDIVVTQLFENGGAFPVRQTKAQGLADAFEIAAAWLDRD